jgi:hypothetical protein
MWSRRAFPVWFFGGLAVALIGHSMALFVLWLILAAGYVISLVIHPRARCLHCDGTGELRGRVYRWTFRRCPRCQGGRIVRHGARWFGLPHVRRQIGQNQQVRDNTTIPQRW